MGCNTLCGLSSVAAIVGILYVIRLILRRLQRVSVQDKVVLITGASSGLGEACAKVFFEAGAKVILCARRQNELDRVKNLLSERQKQGQHTPEVLPMDLTDYSQVHLKVEQAMAFHGRIDIVINNGGISYRGEISQTDISVDQQVMAVNYFGQVALTKALLPYMMSNKDPSHIVMVSSLQGKFSIPFRSAYSASKHALSAFADCLRVEAANHKICVSTVSPGYIATNLSMNAVTGDGSSYGVMDATTAGGMSAEYVAERIKQRVQSGRSGECMLASPVHSAAAYLRLLAPTVYFAIMKRRAQKQKGKTE